MNKKYQALLQKGKDLFWKYGIKRVTIEEICKESGVSKMTFYKFFKSKNELFKVIMDSLAEQSIKEYRIFWDSNISFEEKIEKSIEFKMKNNAEIGQDFINDIYINGDDEIRNYMNAMIEKTLKMVREDFEIAQKNGEISQNISIDFILYMLNHITVMITDNKLTGLYDSPQKLIRDFLEFFYYGIIPRKTNLKK